MTILKKHAGEHAKNACFKPMPPQKHAETNAVKPCLKTCLKHYDNPCQKSMLGMHAVKACLKTVRKNMLQSMLKKRARKSS